MAAKPFSQCSVEEMRKALLRKRKPASIKPLPPEAVELADQYREAVTGRFPKAVLVKMAVRNQKGKAVLDFKGIPVEQVAKRVEALTGELPPVSQVRLVEKVAPRRESRCMSEVAALSCTGGGLRHFSRWRRRESKTPPPARAGGTVLYEAVRGDPGQIAGGSQRGRARPAPVRGAGHKPGTWNAECWRTASHGCAARVARTLIGLPRNWVHAGGLTQGLVECLRVETASRVRER